MILSYRGFQARKVGKLNKMKNIKKMIYKNIENY